jgi:mono/diheme cytochrome c family protein
VIVLALGIPALAHGDAAEGEQLAQLWCASCHVIGGEWPRSFPQGPPSFRSIARGMSVDQLRAFFTKPHGAMPDLSLSRSEMDDLIAYIERLR